jgi:hypothetical protein
VFRWQGHELTGFASLYQLTPDRPFHISLVCAMIRIASLRDTEVMQRGFDFDKV